MSTRPTTSQRPSRQGSDRLLVLGLGNPLLGDDSVGLRVVRDLCPKCDAWPNVSLAEDYWGGLRLMERLVGFERAVIVDAICSGGVPGTVRVLSPDAIPTQHSSSAHDVNLQTALALGRQAGAQLPTTENIRLVAIEAADVLTFCQECTPSVQGAIEQAADTVLAILQTWR